MFTERTPSCNLMADWIVYRPPDYWILAHERIRLCERLNFFLEFCEKWLGDEYSSGEN
jgi:hypothetical protein